MKKIIQWIEARLDDFSIKKKFYIMYVLCVLTPLVITDSIVFGIVRNSDRERQKHEMANIANAVGYSLSSTVNNAGEIAKTIYTNSHIDGFLSKEYENSAEYVSEYQHFFRDNLLENTLGQSNTVFTLYADNKTIVNGGKVNNMIGMRKTRAYKVLNAKKQNKALLFVNDHAPLSLRDERKAVYIQRLDFYSSDMEKYLEIEFDYGSMTRNLKKMNYDNEVLICQGNQIVLSNGSYGSSGSAFELLSGQQNKAYKQSVTLYGTDFDIYVRQSDGSLLNSLKKNSPILIFLIVINALLPLCLVHLFNHSFARRITELSRVFKSVDGEQLVPMFHEGGKDEIGSMIRNYNRMVKRTNELIQTVYKNKLKEQEMLVGRKNAELLALHSQINPHFLFNALESIRMHSILKKENETADMVEKLAVMQRQYVEWGEDFVTVDQELEFVRAYLALQKYRFGDRLNYSLEVEEECRECKIPKLTVVTFVENACVHGIESKAAPGWIFVRIYMEKEQFVIEVEDTGNGMDEETQSGLLYKMQHADIDMLKTKGRVGIVNACLRIKMVSEQQAGFELEGEEGMGTMVVIHIPSRYVQEEKDVKSVTGRR